MIASRRTPAQLANAIRPCCGEGGCYRRRHIRLLDKVRPSMAHTFVAELAACEAGLGREELIKIVVKTARRGLMGLARQSLREMGARGLAPSITAHNAMLEAHAVRGQWSDCLHLLTRMKQAGPEPNTVSYTTAIRASSSSPLAAELARQLLPDLEAIAQRGLAGAAALPPPEPANRRERRQALHRGLPAVTHAPPLQTPWTRSGRELERDRALPPLLAGSECAGHATRASGAEPAAGVANASYGAPRELAPTQRHSRPTIHALLGAASSEPGTALAMLTQLLDEAPFTPSGLPFTPDSGTFTAALRGCASAPGRYREALAIAKRMEAWVREDPRGRASEPELAHALTSAIAACDKASEPAEAIKLLRRFMAMGMPPATAPVTAAICSCRKAGAKGVEEATQLLALMKARGVPRSAWTYNAMLEVFSSAGGMGQRALALLRSMESDGVTPDEVSYTTVLKACKPTVEEAKAMLMGTKRAATQRVVETAADARAVAPPRLPAAASPAAALPPWISAISLLDQMELRGLPPSLHTHNAAIELAALGCDVPAAVRILDRMESRGLQPDGYSWASAMKAAARAGDVSTAMLILDRCGPPLLSSEPALDAHAQPKDTDDHSRAEDGSRRDGAGAEAGTGALAGARSAGRAGGSVYRGEVGWMGGAATRSDAAWLERVFTSALLAIATQPEAAGAYRGRPRFPTMGGDRTGLGSIKGDPLQQALAVWARMQACGVPPSAYTYGALLSACARWRGWREACHVMEQMRARGQPPLASHYEAALRACARAAGRTGTGGLQLGTPEGPMAAVLELAKQAEADGVSVPKATARARHAVVTVLDAHLLMAAGMAGVRSAEL